MLMMTAIAVEKMARVMVENSVSKTCFLERQPRSAPTMQYMDC